MRKAVYGICIALILANVALMIWRVPIVTFVINASAGCWPWSARSVEYRPGMTLCPGQSTSVPVPIPVIPFPLERPIGAARGRRI
jgi:hypothetical protein